MRVSAVNNIRSQRNSFKSSSVNVAPVQPEPSESFKQKKKQIYSVVATAVTLTGIFAYFYMGKREATWAAIKKILRIKDKIPTPQPRA